MKYVLKVYTSVFKISESVFCTYIMYVRVVWRYNPRVSGVQYKGKYVINDFGLMYGGQIGIQGKSVRI